MHQPRPYRVWCKEIVDVTKEVFWIFLHHLNVVSLPSAAGAAAAEPKAIEQTPPPESILSSDKPLPKNPTTTTSPSSSAPPPNDWPLPRPTSSCSKASYTSRHFPGERPIVPAAPYVGGVEWDATNYLATHLDLLNGLLASLPTRSERNELRMLVRDSGFEKAMGAQLRTCKEKFYGAVHVALRTWVAAASEDGWDVSDVRFGPKVEEVRSVRASPKKKVEKAPKLEIPPELKLDVGAGGEGQKGEKTESGDNWTFDI